MSRISEVPSSHCFFPSRLVHRASTCLYWWPPALEAIPSLGIVCVDHKNLHIATELAVAQCLGMISVLVADSERLFGESLRIALSYEPGLDVLERQPSTGLEAMREIVRHRPDVAVLDYWIRGMEGPAAVRLVRARNPEQTVILSAWFHGPAEVQEAYHAGAAAFLSKDIEVSHLVEVIRRVHGGARMLELEELEVQAPAKGGRSEQEWDRLVTLTVRELEILSCLAKSGRPEEVAEELSISAGTMRIHINHITAKTGARSQVEAVVLARQYGLI